MCCFISWKKIISTFYRSAFQNLYFLIFLWNTRVFFLFIQIFILLLKDRMWILVTPLLAGSRDAFVGKSLCAFLWVFFSDQGQPPNSSPSVDLISCWLFTIVLWSSASVCKPEGNGICLPSSHVPKKCTLGQFAALQLSLCAALQWTGDLSWV